MSLRRAWSLGLLTCLCLVQTVISVTTASPAQADATTPFASRATFTDNGAVVLTGNNLLSCPSSATDCAAARQGTGSKLNDNNFAMANVDADATPSTFNSTSSQLNLAGGSTVLWAGLYWGARLDGGTGGHVAPSRALRNQMSLRGPSDSSYRTITADVDFGPYEASSDAYQEFADVTSIVQAQGGGTWWAANVQAGTGEDRYAGWTLAVVYRNAGLPLRNITVFDGFNMVSQGNPQTIGISGFLTPRTGPVQTQLGIVAYEGDLGQAGDTATLTSGSNATQLATTLSTGNNFFNSSNDFNGSNATTRSPADRNMFGFDIKASGAPNAIPNNATSATLTLDTTNDTYFPGVMTMAIDLFAPDFTSSVKTVTNVDGDDPAGPGNVLQYTVNLTNTGGDPATGALLSDVLPPATTYVPGSLRVLNGPNAGPKSDAAGDDQAEYVAETRTVAVRVGAGANAASGGTMGVNSATAVTFQVTVDATAAGTTLTNRAALSYTAATIGRQFSYLTNAVDTRVVANADLAVTKSAQATVDAGETATSAITVTNRGPNAAQNVQLTDALPAGVTFVSASPGSAACTASTGQVSCSLGTLADGASTTVSVLVRIPSNSTDSAITDLATVTSDTNDPVPANNAAGATTGIGAAADVSITKSATPSSVAPGQTITFPITVHNNGPSDARSITVSDQFDPSQLSPVSVDHGDACRLSSTGFNCSLSSLAAGDSYVVNLVAQVTPDFTGTTVSNTVTAHAQTPDPLADNNSATADVTVGDPIADLALTKSASSGTVPAGGQVTYTLIVTNPTGPSDATAVRVTDTLPAGLTAVQAVSSVGTCDVGPTVTCTVDRLAVRGTATITITAAVSPDATLGPSLNTASVRSENSTDPDTADNADSATVDIVGRADVGIRKSGAGTPVAGAPISYTLTVVNNGPSRARGITVSDPLPDSLTDIDVPAGCTLAGQVVTCTADELAVGAGTGFTVTATVAETFPGGDIANTATVVTDGTTDPNPADNRATFTSTVSAAADLSLTKTAPAAATAGDTITYQLEVSNAGPSAAADVTVTDPLPDGLTAVTASAGCTLGNTVSCRLGSLSTGAAAQVTITARVGPGLDAGTVLTNTAHTGSTTNDPSDSNNTATAATTISTSADISVAKMLVTPPPLAPGQLLTFRIVVHNDGPSVARTLVLHDSVDGVAADVVDVTIDGDDGIGQCALSAAGDFTCRLPDLAAGATADVGLVIVTDPGADLAGYTNTASVSAVTPDPNPDDNTSVAPFTFDRTEADLTISKAGSAQLVAGTAFRYQITVNDAIGPSDAVGVVVTDALPPGLVATQAIATQGSCTIAAGVVTCRLGRVARVALQPVITVTGTVAGDAATGPIVNTATATSSTPDPNVANNDAAFGSTITRQANLSLTKTADADPLVAGTRVGYTLTVTNAGPSDATDVTLTDTMPAAVTFDPTVDPRCAQGAGIECALGVIPAGTTVVVRVAGQLDSSYAGDSFVNTASVSSPVTDPNPEDDVASLTSSVVRRADLSVTKLAVPSTAAAGTDVSYPITVINNGPSDAVNGSFSDPLPLPPIGFAGPSQDDVTCEVDGLTRICTVARLRPGQSRTGQITIHLPADQPAGTLLNTATVGADTPDPNVANDAMTAPVNVVLMADLTLTKRVVTDPVVAGAPVTYTLDVTNRGPSIAPDTLITDPLAAGVAFVSGSAGCDATPSESGTDVIGCSLGTLGAGDTAHATITVLPPANATGEFTNSAAVGSRGQDPAPDDNTSTVSSRLTTPPPPADVAVSVVAQTPSVRPGGVAGYTVTVTNLGPSPATNVILVNDLPAQVSDPQDPPACTFAGNTATCTPGTLAVGATVTITFRGTVPALPAGTALVDTATVSHGQADPVVANDQARATIAVAGSPTTSPTTTSPASTSSPAATTSATTATTATTPAPVSTGTAAPPTAAPPTAAPPTAAPPTAAPPDAGQMPNTGVDVAGLGAVALALLALGTGLAIGGRRRRRS